MLNWYYVTKAQYTAAAAHSSDNLYFLSDTKEIYRGDDLFTQSVIMYTGDLPTAPAVGQLYINETTLEGKTYTGTAWKTVIKAVADTVTADGTNPVSGKAVAAYVTDALKAAAAEAQAAFKEVTYSKTTNKLTFTSNDGKTHEVEIDNLPVDLAFDKTGTEGTGKLQLKDKAGNVIGTGVDLDLERFVKSGEYDAATKKITLYFDDKKTDKVEIDATALVDIYTGKASATASTSVSATNEISVDVKISDKTGNILKSDANGLYVDAVDQSAKMDKDADAVAGNLAKFDADGNAVDAGLKAGGAALAETTDATTLATEKAVEAAVSAETTRAMAAEGKLNTAVEAAKKAADDAAAAVVTEKERAEGVEGTLDTAVKAAKKTADDEVTRAKKAEQDLIDALTWKTTIA
nr:MAG TPA: hypothetical protein [Caudoviricetes sp.]